MLILLPKGKVRIGRHLRFSSPVDVRRGQTGAACHTGLFIPNSMGGFIGDRLKEKVAIVTGAGSVGPRWGNGKAVAVLFAREGAFARIAFFCGRRIRASVPPAVKTVFLRIASARRRRLKRHTVFLEFFVEQGAVDAEHLGGAGLVEAGGFQRAPKGFPFRPNAGRV